MHRTNLSEPYSSAYFSRLYVRVKLCGAVHVCAGKELLLYSSSNTILFVFILGLMPKHRCFCSLPSLQRLFCLGRGKWCSNGGL